MTKTCLIVDDSKIVRKVARKIFEAQNFSVSEAENGEEALKSCAASMPDVVLLDWHMPVMDGLQCIQGLRAMEGGSKPVVIFCTTETDINKITAALSEGANEYVMKPFDNDIIEGKLRQLGLI